MSARIRNYRPEDLPGIVNLLNAASAADHLDDGTSIQEMQAELARPQLNPEENVFVAVDEQGRIVGLALLWLIKEPSQHGFRSFFRIHPIQRGRRLEERLLEQLAGRAQARMSECETLTVHLDSTASVLERDKLAALERFGMKEIRRFWVMVRPDLSSVPEPRWPSDLLARPYRVREDDAAVHRADVDAFQDHWGYAPLPFESWLHYVALPIFRPELTVIAEDPSSHEVAGLCVITVNAEENRRLGVERGWIDILAVRRSYRRRGLGTALILSGLRNLRAAGLQQAALGCDSENLTGATRIYERVGFRVDKTQIAFRKYLRGEMPAPAPSPHQEKVVSVT